MLPLRLSGSGDSMANGAVKTARKKMAPDSRLTRKTSESTSKSVPLRGRRPGARLGVLSKNPGVGGIVSMRKMLQIAHARGASPPPLEGLGKGKWVKASCADASFARDHEA